MLNMEAEAKRLCVGLRTRLVLLAVLAAAVAAGCVGGGDRFDEPITDISDEADRLSLISFNIRYDNPNDDPDWSTRLNAIELMLSERRPELLGIQEGLEHQVIDLAEVLPGYAWVGVGRDDGASAGEFVALFYRTDALTLVDHGTFWLSETPDVPSVGWDASHKRIATWAELRRVDSSATFFAFNTHLDNEGEIARDESAKLLADKMSDISGDRPAFVMGDFNTLILDPALDPLLEVLADARTTAPTSDIVGSFNGRMLRQGIRNIDFIFYNSGTPIRFETIDDNFGVTYISDHYPILATISCPECG